MRLIECACRYKESLERGFWDTPFVLDDDGRRRIIAEKMLMVVGELIEAHEELRAGQGLTQVYYTTPSGKRSDTPTLVEGGALLKPEGFPVEVVDALIRLEDLLGWLHAQGVDIERVYQEKLAFNATRGRRHGKTC
jgi:hypothetical protein